MSAAAANPTELSFRAWVRSEAQDRDAIKVKRIYIDVNDGNLTDGILFSQIMYWHTPTPEGKDRLTIKRNGHLWLAKSYEEWLQECRIPERTVRIASITGTSTDLPKDPEHNTAGMGVLSMLQDLKLDFGIELSILSTCAAMPSKPASISDVLMLSIRWYPNGTV